VDAINPAHGSVLRVNSPSLGIFSLPLPHLVSDPSGRGAGHEMEREGDETRVTVVTRIR